MDDYRFLLSQAEAALATPGDEIVSRELTRQPVPPVEFQPPEVTAAQRRAEAAEAARVAQLERGVFMPAGADIVAQRQAEQERQLAEQERRRAGRVAMPGVADPVEVSSTRGMIPLLRPTRITEEQAVALDTGGVSPLLPEYQRQELLRRAVPLADVPAPYTAEALLESPDLTTRVYTDPETGQRSEPTAGQEAWEAFALQTEVPEARYREEQERRRQRIESGDATAYEAYLAPALQRLIQKPDQTRGLVETPLMAGLRSTLGWVSAAAAEGYFAGLGYDVDENGVPVNPDDFGYAVAELRRSFGIPDVIRVNPVLPYEEQAYNDARQLGFSDETARTIQNLVYSLPTFTVPTPGVATTRTQRKTTTYDPEGRRRVEDTEIRPLGQGFLQDEFRRIAQNVAKGRSWGDELADAPEVTAFFDRVYEDPDAAYLSGIALEVLQPTGIGIASGAVRGAGSVARAAGVGADATRARGIRAAVDEIGTYERAIERGSRQAEAARAAGDTAAAAAAQNVVATATRQLQRSTTRLRQLETTQTTPRIMRAVTEQAIKRTLPEAAQPAALRLVADRAPAALADVVELLDDLPVSAIQRSRVLRLVERNTPADYVLISDTVAVPRQLAAEARTVLARKRQESFLKTVPEILNDVEALDLTPELARQARGLVQDYAQRYASAAEDVAPLGWAGLPPDIRAGLQRIVAAHSRAAGLGSDAARRFDQLSPAAAAERFTAAPAFRRQLAEYASWDDVPAALRRQYETLVDTASLSALPASARRAGDLTRAQIYFKTAESGLTRVLNTLSAGRRPSLQVRDTLARFPWLNRLQTETLSAARAARSIERLGLTVLRRAGRLVNARAAALGSVDAALTEVLETSARGAGVGAPQVWNSLLEQLYGPRKDAVIGQILESGLLGAGDDAAQIFRTYPTVDAVKALDAALTSPRGGNLFIQPEIGVLQRLYAPDVQRAFLKTIVEQGLKRQILQDQRLLEALQRARVPADEVARFVNTIPDAGAGADIARQLDAYPAPRGLNEPLPVELGATTGQRVAVYDTAASAAERELALGAEGLFRQLDSIPVRQRADSARMLKDAIDSVFATGQRNLAQRVSYGYILPNLPVQLGRFAQMALVPLATIGAGNALRAAGRLTQTSAQRAVNAIARRRMFGGGLTTPEGVYYSPQTIDRLADSYGLGVSQLESARVGSLAGDLLRDAKAAARGKPALNAALEVINPFQKGYFLRMSEALELNYRRSVFETLIAAGKPPAEAAEAARVSQLDYADAPGVVRDFAARFIGEAANLYQIGVQALVQLIERPSAAARILRIQRQKAEAQDPYNIHGDKALKSLGLIQTPQKTFYLPELPIFTGAEQALALLRQADLLVDDIRHAARVAPEEVLPVFMERAGVPLLRGVASTVVPAVLDAYDRFTDGEGYQTTGVPNAEPMTDEKMFWAAMLAANHLDPERRPDGAWEAFSTLFEPRHVPPPPGAGHPDYPLAWTRQPPEGVPHIEYGITDDGQRLYYVAEPTERGLASIKIARQLGADRIARAVPLYLAANKDDSQRRRPVRIYSAPLLETDSLKSAILNDMLGAVPTVPALERRRQAETVRQIAED